MSAKHDCPLSDSQQQQVIDATRACIKKAEALFPIKSRAVDIHFNLRGRSAGMYRIRQHGRGLFKKQQREIRYNPYIFQQYFEDNLKTTVPHEVAHYISDLLYGLKNIKPHGQEWKQIMRAFDADASVTASYDLSNIPHRRLRRFSYQCQCREHQLTAIRHNRILNSRVRYYCTRCKQPLSIKNG
ncbi:MAG TPA: metallopeptidase (SprT family) [Gammaproteobacteria bacterium]|nr:metallopeptidase (SprT family) [Gammaproteobacteria bacterium]